MNNPLSQCTGTVSLYRDYKNTDMVMNINNRLLRNHRSPVERERVWQTATARVRQSQIRQTHRENTQLHCGNSFTKTIPVITLAHEQYLFAH